MKEQENIDELIAKFLSGNALPEEALFLEEWKNASAENAAYYAQCERAFALSEELPSFGNDEAWKKVQATIQPVKPKIVSLPVQPRKKTFRMAAAIALLVSMSTVLFLLLKPNGAEEKINYSASQTERKIQLKDGSDVTIAPNSSITADADFGKKQRLLHLKGNAYFSVVHDDKIPFVIDAGEVFIKDIGTKFSIRNSPDSDTVFVHVDEGIVLVFDSAGSEITITANGNALYVRSSKKIISSAEAASKNAQLNFNASPLSEVLSRLSEKYKVDIQIENAEAGKCPVTTSFQNENIETVLSVLCETTGLSYQKTAQGYLIKGEKCNR